MRRIFSTVLVKVIGWVQTKVLLPTTAWGLRGAMEVDAQQPGEQGEYITPLATINFAVLCAAEDDWRKAWDTDPENCQAALNACLESLRHERFCDGFLAFMGQLAAEGYPPPEIMSRLASNILILGMSLERRLAK